MSEEQFAGQRRLQYERPGGIRDARSQEREAGEKAKVPDTVENRVHENPGKSSIRSKQVETGG